MSSPGPTASEGSAGSTSHKVPALERDAGLLQALMGSESGDGSTLHALTAHARAIAADTARKDDLPIPELIRRFNGSAAKHGADGRRAKVARRRS
jgi:hypothetical protein